MSPRRRHASFAHTKCQAVRDTPGATECAAPEDKDLLAAVAEKLRVHGRSLRKFPLAASRHGRSIAAAFDVQAVARASCDELVLTRAPLSSKEQSCNSRTHMLSLNRLDQGLAQGELLVEHGKSKKLADW